MLKNISLPALVFLLVLFLLVPVQLKVERPMLLLERFVRVEDGSKCCSLPPMEHWWPIKCRILPRCTLWRKYTWFAFSVVFFSQLAPGPRGFRKVPDDRQTASAHPHDDCRRSHLQGTHLGDDHPLSFHRAAVRSGLVQPPVLFWCNGFTWLGRRPEKGAIRNKWALKSTVVLLVVAGALFMRYGT